MDFPTHYKFRFFGGEIEKGIVGVYYAPAFKRIAVIKERVELLVYFWSEIKPLTSSTIQIPEIV